MYPTHTQSSEEYARTLALYHWLSSVMHEEMVSEDTTFKVHF